MKCVVEKACFQRLESSILGMNCSGLFPGCEVNKVEHSEAGLTFFLQVRGRSSHCPICGWRPKRVHSYYTRFFTDTALGERAVYLKLNMRRFYRLNASCQQRTFTERIVLFGPHARRTLRLTNLQATVGTFFGGEAGARLLQKL